MFGILVTWQLVLMIYQCNELHLMRERGISYLNNANLTDVTRVNNYLERIQCRGCTYDITVEERQFVLNVQKRLEIPVLGLKKDVKLTGVSYVKEK